MKKLITLTSVFVLAVAFTAVAYAQSNVKQEINTAHAHALMAQSASSVDMAHTHLHHVINCLVGPDGKAFNSSFAYPCKGQGNGAIPDASGNSALQSKLKTALADAQAGLKASSLSSIHEQAGKVAAALGDTSPQQASGGYSW